MRTKVIIDTSALVAFINKGDNYHQWAKSQWQNIKPPLLTCESVIAESLFLLQKVYGGQEILIAMLEREVVIAVLNKARYVIRVVTLTTQKSIYTSSLRETL